MPSGAQAKSSWLKPSDEDMGFADLAGLELGPLDRITGESYRGVKARKLAGKEKD
jgi:hypothetical protein